MHVCAGSDKPMRRLHTVPTPSPKPGPPLPLPPLSLSGLGLPATPAPGASVTLNQIVAPFGISLGDLGNSITVPPMPSVPPAGKGPPQAKPAMQAPSTVHSNSGTMVSVKIADLFGNGGGGGG